MKPQIPLISSSDLKSRVTYSEQDILKADNIFNPDGSMFRDFEATFLNNAIQYILNTPYTELIFDDSPNIHIGVALDTTRVASLELYLGEGYKDPKDNMMEVRILIPWLSDYAMHVLGFRDMSFLMTTVKYSQDSDSNYQKLYNYYVGARQYYLNIMEPELKKHTKKCQKMLSLMIKANNKRNNTQN